MGTLSVDDLDISRNSEDISVSTPHPNKGIKVHHKILTTCKSSPNLIGKLGDIEKHNSPSKLFKNLSDDCLNSPPFTNPHKSLIHLWQKYANKSVACMKPFLFIRRELKNIEDIYNYCNKDNTFTVKLRKHNRGLGLSICGGKDASVKDQYSQLIRILNLHPLQPALECGKLALGDIILEVNGSSMLGLTKNEALDVFRSASTDVELTIFRPPKSFLPPFSEFKASMRSSSNYSSISTKNAAPSVESTASNTQLSEFEVTLLKRDGCLGFSIFHEDSTENSAGGVYVKELTREHAISDGRIRPRDRILKVNGTDVSSFSLSDALKCLRETPELVSLVLCRSKDGTSVSSKSSVSENHEEKFLEEY